MLEKISFFIELFISTVASIIRIIFFTRPIVKKKISFSTSELVILANGPSLNNLIANHIYFLQAKTLICVNFFPTTSYFEKLKPQILVISAPELWRSDATDNYKTLSQQLFETIKIKTTWPLYLFLPFSAKKYPEWKKALGNNNFIQIHYYNLTPIEGFKWFRHLMYTLQWGMPRPHNVLIPSIMIGMYLGFKKIYLWGADHSWLKEITVDDNNQVLVNQKHFYDENTSKPLPMNKFRGTRKLYEVLIKFVHAFKGYIDIENYAQSRNIEIYNATPNSYIDAFKRIKL